MTLTTVLRGSIQTFCSATLLISYFEGDRLKCRGVRESGESSGGGKRPVKLNMIIARCYLLFAAVGRALARLKSAHAVLFRWVEKWRSRFDTPKDTELGTMQMQYIELTSEPARCAQFSDGCFVAVTPISNVCLAERASQHQNITARGEMLMIL